VQSKYVTAFLFTCICLLVITGCETLDLGPGPTVIMGPNQPAKQKQQDVAYKKERLTAPDEDAPLSPTPPSARQTVLAENLDGSPSGQRTALTGVRTRPEMIFTGKVTRLDMTSRTIAVQSSDKHLAFDLVNPTLRGYESVNDIKIGDIVSLGYISNAIAIAKGETFPEDLKPQTVADDLSTPKVNGRRSKQTANNRGAPVRVKYKINRMSFAEVDNNKDGKISPVELGTVLPSVTMEKFKQYDRNGDGFLDANEYKAVRK
jgi:hypothetical protein